MPIIPPNNNFDLILADYVPSDDENTMNEEEIELDIFRTSLGLSYDEFDDYFENTDFEIFLEEKDKALSKYFEGLEESHLLMEELEEPEYFSENNFDAHGNYMDDNYFFKRDYEGNSCSLDFDEEECAF